MMFRVNVREVAAVLCGVAAVMGFGPAAADHPGAAEGTHPIDSLEPRQWFEIPDSHMRKVAFKWPRGVKHGRIASIMAAWSGGVYDTKRDRLVIWGGGHSDYAGNELYAFDVKKLKWKRINDPSLRVDLEGKLERTGVYADGKPRSCHTYDYIEYAPSTDRLCAFGVGAPWPFARSVNPDDLVTWAFDFGTGRWEKKSRIPFRIHASAWDPVSGRVWMRSRFAPYVAQWDPTKDAWTVRSKRLTGGGNFWVMGVVDPIGRRFLTLGGGYFWAYDIGRDGLLSQEEIRSTGPQEIVKARMGAGVEYDPVLDKLVCWNGGADVYALDLAELVWERLAPAADNEAVPGTPPKAGTWGRWRYVPSKNAYIVVNAVDRNVFIHRLTRRAVQPIPKRFAEALKTSDAALVKWVAGEVVKWPREKAQPVLKAAVAHRGRADGRQVAEVLENALRKLK